jgi:hypothetical protein
MKSILRTALSFLLAFVALGCNRKPESSQQSVSSGGYFQTPFQSESQFIVEAIVSDLAEQMFFAVHHRLPDKNHFLVRATEKAGSTADVPLYNLQIRLEPKKSDIQMELKIDGPIWSAEVYQGVAEALARATGLAAGSGGRAEDTGLLAKLIDGKAETIEEQNKELSAALEEDFANSELHEQAALLISLKFVLRSRE